MLSGTVVINLHNNFQDAAGADRLSMCTVTFSQSHPLGKAISPRQLQFHCYQGKTIKPEEHFKRVNYSSFVFPSVDIHNIEQMVFIALCLPR